MIEEERETEAKVPRVGVTTVSKLLTGDDVCHLKPWYERRHPEEAPPDDGRLLNWTLNHNELVTKIVQGLKEGEVKREIWFIQDNPPVWGKIDVVNSRPGEYHIYEIKSGKRSNAHILQLFVYMHIARKTDPKLKDVSIQGHLVYPDQQMLFKENAVPPDLDQKMEPHVSVILGETPPKPIQNRTCRFCWADCQYAGARPQMKFSGSG